MKMCKEHHGAARLGRSVWAGLWKRCGQSALRGCQRAYHTAKTPRGFKSGVG